MSDFFLFLWTAFMVWQYFKGLGKHRKEGWWATLIIVVWLVVYLGIRQIH